MKPVLFFLLVAVPTIAFAQSNSAADLRNSGVDYVRVCGPTSDGKPSQFAGACNVWLAGVLDGLQAYNSNVKSIPLFDASNVAVGQVSTLVIKYVADHPGQAQFPAAAVVLATLSQNYPRKESAAPPTK